MSSVDGRQVPQSEYEMYAQQIKKSQFVFTDIYKTEYESTQSPVNPRNVSFKPVFDHKQLHLNRKRHISNEKRTSQSAGRYILEMLIVKFYEHELRLTHKIIL